MNNLERVFMAGKYAAFKGKPRQLPLNLEMDTRADLKRAWYDGWDAETNYMIRSGLATPGSLKTR